MTTAETIGTALKIVVLLLGFLLERNSEKKVQKAAIIKAIEATLKKSLEAVDAGNISDFHRSLGSPGGGL